MKNARVSLNLPDALHRQAKKAALKKGMTLSQFVAEAVSLRLRLDVPPMPVFCPPAGEEGWQPGVNIDDSAGCRT